MAVTDTWASGQTFTAADEDAVAQAINGSGWLQPCHAATTGSETYTIVSGNVTQLSGTTIDGIAVSVNDRILIKDAPASSGAGSTFSRRPANGVYQVTGISSNIAVSRVYEMSGSPPTPYVPAGAVVSVMAGTSNAGLVFIVAVPNNPGSFTFGGGNIGWSPVGYVAGTGLTLTGSTLSLSATAQTNLSLAASSVQSAGNVLTLMGSTVQVSSMSTGQVILGNAGTPTITTLGGDLSLGATGVATIVSGAISLSKMANLAATSVIGNATGSPATPTAVPLTSLATSSTVAYRDSSANLGANTFISGTATTVTAGGTTTLTVASGEVQRFTGTATQTVVLPDATTCRVGHQLFVTNRATAAVTVQDNSTSTLQVLAPGSQSIFTLITNGSAAGTWDVAYTVTSPVTTVSVTSANGFGGSVSNPTTTPALSITTSVTGLLKGDGTGVSAAVSGTDYAPATTGSSILKASSGGFTSAVSGTDYAPATSGTSALKGSGSGGFANATLTDVGTPTANFSMGGFLLNNVGTPSASTDAATKSYVDTVAQGLSSKYSAVAATNTETLTIASGSVTQISGTTVDSQSPNVGDYVLIMNAGASTGAAGGTGLTSVPANGLYQVTNNTTNLSVSRAANMSGSVRPNGAYIFVSGGPTWGGGGFVVTTPSGSGSFTYGTNNIGLTQFTGAGEITAGTGLSKSGNTLSVNLTGGTAITVSGANISVTGSSIGTTQLSATGTKNSTTYLRGDNTWADFSSAVGTSWSAGTGINISGAVISVANASLGPTQFSATGTANNTTYLRGDNTWSNFNSAVTAIALSSMATPTAGVSWGGYGLTNLANPVNNQDAATKVYVDSAVYHPSARAATTGLETYTITSGTVTQIAGTTIDGVSVSVGDRILVKDAPSTSGTGTILSSQPGNGLYVVTNNTTNLTVSRVADMSSAGSSSTPAGSAVIVEAGSVSAATHWTVSSPSSSAAFTYGTTAIQWTPIIGVSNVLTRSGNTIQVSSMATGTAIIGNAGTPTITALSGDVTVGATGTTTIGAGAVSLSKMANLAANSVIGNTSGSAATPAALSVTSAATAGAVAIRDSNANLYANAFVESATTTATAAGTTTLTVGSTSFQQFTGTSTQTVVLPNATTLNTGRKFTIANRSTGSVTVQDSTTATLQVVAAGNVVVFTLLSNSGSAGTWDLSYTGSLSSPTITSPTITGYTESVNAIGTVTTSSTLSLASGTVLTATLTASTACTFTMPTAVAGQSFMLFLKQAASTGNGTATFTGVKWPATGTPTMTATAGKTDLFVFVSDGTSWYGNYNQGF